VRRSREPSDGPQARPCRLTYAPASRASWLAIEPHYAGRTVHEDALPRVKAAVLEQPLHAEIRPGINAGRAPVDNKSAAAV